MAARRVNTPRKVAQRLIFSALERSLLLERIYVPDDVLVEDRTT
jgi:hypothetical protein